MYKFHDIVTYLQTDITECKRTFVKHGNLFFISLYKKGHRIARNLANWKFEWDWHFARDAVLVEVKSPVYTHTTKTILILRMEKVMFSLCLSVYTQGDFLISIP